MPTPPEPPHNSDEKNSREPYRPGSDLPFYLCFGLISAFYLLMILAMLVAESTYTTPTKFFEFLKNEEIRYSIKLSLFACGVTTLLSLCVAVPIGYLMSRYQFWGKSFVDSVLDIPIVLPPLVIGLCLLILFNSSLAVHIEEILLGVESLLSHNLVPLGFLLFLSLFGILFYFLSRHRISRRLTRLSIPVVLITILMLLFFRSYLFPQLPQWVPNLSQLGLQQQSVTFRDQHPVSLSKHVYSSEYTYQGRGAELISRLTKQWEKNKALDDDIKVIPQPGRDGLETGEQLITTTFAAGVDSRFPDGGELELRLVPEKPTEQLTLLQAELTEIRNQQEPVLREYQAQRAKLNVSNEVATIRDQLNQTEKKWQSQSLVQSITSIKSSLTAIEQAVQTAQREIDTLQTSDQIKKIETELKQLDLNLNEVKEEPARQVLINKRVALTKMQQNITLLLKLKSKIDANEQKLREVSLKRDKISNQWRTDSVQWLVSLNILRPSLLSEKDISPTLLFPVTYAIPSVILAQFMVACAFAVRTMRVTFDQIHPRFEQVALTLGCNSGQAFWKVVFPQAKRGMLAAATLAWARSLGEFGPILIFSGTIPLKTEVLPSSVFLQFTTGNLSGAVSASLIIIFAALIVLVVARLLGLRRMSM